MRSRTAQSCAVTVELQTYGWLQDSMFQLGWMAAGRTASWQDGCVGPSHRAVPLSEQGHAVAICQRTVLSHLAALPVPRARISQAFINHSSTASASPRLCGEPRQEANKRLCVLAAAAAAYVELCLSARAGSKLAGTELVPTSGYTWAHMAECCSILTSAQSPA